MKASEQLVALVTEAVDVNEPSEISGAREHGPFFSGEASLPIRTSFGV